MITLWIIKPQGVPIPIKVLFSVNAIKCPICIFIILHHWNNEFWDTNWLYSEIFTIDKVAVTGAPHVHKKTGKFHTGERAHYNHDIPANHPKEEELVLILI